MEILTTGEKIKRARIYLNLTLKELCQSEISMSKMSCIENNKIEAEQWILKLVSERLRVPFEYLNESSEDQIRKNIDVISNSTKDNTYEKNIRYNIDYAESIQAYDLSLKLMHMLYNYYLDIDKLEDIEVLNFKYYDLYQKSSNEEERINYFLDKGRYLCRRKEYSQAGSYFDNLRMEVINKENLTDEDYNNYIIISYYSIYCKEQLKQYGHAYEGVIETIKDLDKANNEEYKAEIYKIASIISLILDKAEFVVYRDKYFSLSKTNQIEKSHTMLRYGEILIRRNCIEDAEKYIDQAINEFPDEDNKEKIKFKLCCLELFVENNFIDKAEGMCDQAVDLAINLNEIRFIEKAYYFKSIISQKRELYTQAEMHMNLSLDALMKFGSRNELHKRYMEMGKMYYKMQEVADSIKYFDLAMKLEKKI